MTAHALATVPPLRSRPVTRARRGASRLGLVATGALTLGGLTSWAQLALPPALAPLANSVSGWTLVAVLLVALAGGGRTSSAVLGMVAFAGLAIGYGLVSTERGYFFDPSTWVAVGAVAGPVVGVATTTALSGPGVQRAAGVAVLPGLIAGDGLYGLTSVASSTGSSYWLGALLAAGAGLALSLWKLARSARERVVLSVVASGVALGYPLALTLLAAVAFGG